MRSRVLWKCISGVRSDFIRQEIFRMKWMTKEGIPKEYDEILSVADEALSVVKVMTATSPWGNVDKGCQWW